ncbi:MAG: EAL domain-containing protein, partial [Phascolarctobacterium sp.]
MDSIILGTVIIDANCHIVDFNEAAAKAIPQLAKGELCFKAFLNKEKPCTFCPILKQECYAEVAADVHSESSLEIATTHGEKLHVVSFIIDKRSSKSNLSCMKYNLDAYATDSRNLKDKMEQDSVTGLYNMWAFTEQAERLMRENPEERFDLFITRIKNYQFINATYGEARTQALLRSLADFALVKNQGGIVGRYSVDQFVSVCKALSMEYRLGFFKAYKEFRESLPIPNVIINFGIYRNVDRTTSINNMCSKALVALNSIKDYRRTFAQYNDDITQNQMKAQSYESVFYDALKQREFQVWYQPKYDAITERIVGAEALVRWQSKQGIISPGEFLPIFEADGLIAELDRYVFSLVCEQQQKWLAEGRELFPISVNISRNSLFGHNVVHKYKNIIDEYGIEPKFVPIEITESVALENIKIKPIADAFTSAGFLLHMDDFGSGRSSLNGLNVLNFEAVKLDKSLIDFIGQENGELILDHTIALGRELGIILVAEGVETAAQLEFLKNKGCQVIQGFYYSKPLPLAEFEQKLAQNGYESLDTFMQKTICSRLPYMNATHLVERMPGGFFCYEAFGEERILASNSYLWRMFGFDNEADFMEHVHGSFKGIVCPEELE